MTLGILIGAGLAYDTRKANFSPSEIKCQRGDSHWALVVRKAKLNRSSNSNTWHLLSVYPSARHCLGIVYELCCLIVTNTL